MLACPEKWSKESEGSLRKNQSIRFLRKQAKPAPKVQVEEVMVDRKTDTCFPVTRLRGDDNKI
jgi:hypothetical protein